MTASLDMSVLVFDVGGSHVAAAVCFAKGYRLGPVISAPHPKQETSGAFVSTLHGLGVRALAGFEDVLGAELAFPGPFDFEVGVSRMRHKLPYLYGVDLRGELAARFGWEPEQVRFLHDSAAFLLGEIGAGAARGMARVVGITLGTGIGSAFAVDGQIVTEGRGVPPGGEVWDLPYEGADAFEEFGKHLGTALRGALAAFAPEAIVLGGGISRSPHLFLPAAQRELDDVHVELRVSALLDDAPLAGAGVAWFNGSKAKLLQAAHASAD